MTTSAREPRPTGPQPPAVEHRHWFESLERQHEAGRFGMWLFVGSEALLFAGLFALYTAYRLRYTALFAEASKHNNIAIGSINTAILICSSFTIAWAIHTVRSGRQRVAVLSLATTALLGCVFLMLKGWEYSQHFREGIFPGHLYRFHELPQRGAKMFFTLYYIMTGLHALHVIGGIAMVLVLLTLALRGRFTANHHPALENGGLYWHLIDAIWIFLWPLLYLTG